MLQLARFEIQPHVGDLRFDTPHDYVLVFLEHLTDRTEEEALRSLNLDLSPLRSDCEHLLAVASRHFKLGQCPTLPEGCFSGNDLIRLIEAELTRRNQISGTLILLKKEVF